ncbi:SCF ubiquitin ligase complex subunit cdc4 [Marasmius sp. AFHP31]|nr:SCF ubiquitin ligase complex subunit cdc4 [Marasmius sp. AFHP31]
MDKGRDSQVYCRTLYSLGHGCALWGPEPNDDLPSEYRESGTKVGDVGLVTSDGHFDFLFNVCLPEDDPINRYNGVPPGFEPLEWDMKCLRKAKWFRPQKPICSKDSLQWSLDIEATASVFGVPVGAGGGIGVVFIGEQGAAVMPRMDGADRTDASNKALFMEYAARNGMSWYQFVNGTLGREADNGELYLITGFDKTNSWENAVVTNHSTSKSCQLAFTTGGLGAEGRLRLSHSTSHESSIISRCSSDEDFHNQSLFIRGFRISNELIPGSDSSDLGSEESELSSGDSATSVEEGDLVPDPKIYHPLVAINEYILRTQVDSTVVVTHDDDWIPLLNGGQDGDTLPDDPTLINRFRAKMTVILNAHGTLDVNNAPPISGSNEQGYSTLGPWDSDSRRSGPTDGQPRPSLPSVDSILRHLGPWPSRRAEQSRDEMLLSIDEIAED